jgi:hypothetical protein
MESFPTSPSVYILYASFLIESRKDGQGARTNLQLASKNSPSFIDRCEPAPCCAAAGWQRFWLPARLQLQLVPEPECCSRKPSH